MVCYRNWTRMCSGKPIVNSISLKEGEEEFIHQANLAKNMERYYCHGF